MRKNGRKSPSSFLLGFLPFAALAILWVIMVHGFSVPDVFLPRLELMPSVAWNMFAQENIAKDIAISCYRVLLGFLIAVLLATPIGIFMGYSQRASQVFQPIIGFIRYIPVPVFIPLTILWFHSGDLQKMIVIFLGAFFQLVLMVADASHSVPKHYYESATLLGASRRDLILRVLWPAALPQIWNSYRICMGWAWTYLVVAEIVGANTGIGYYIVKAQRYLQIPQIFAAMAIVGFLGMITDFVFSVSHTRLFPWAQKAGRE